MGKSLRVIFMGTPAFAVAGLHGILESPHEVVAIVTAPDRPAGRGKKLRFSAVKEEALAQDIPLLQPEKLNDKNIINQLKAFNADVFVVVAFRVLPKVIWKIPTLGTFNLHASLLPHYRGAAPIHWAIINGEKETGLTTFLIDEKIDTGSILLQKSIAVNPEETMGELSLRMQALSGEMIVNTLDDLTKESTIAIPQPNSKDLVPAPKLTRENTRVDWGKNGQDIVNQIHGLNPFPTAWSMLEFSDEELYVKLKRAHFIVGTPINPPGTITIEDQQLNVAVSDGYVYVDELQLPNKKSMETDALLNGFHFPEKCRFV
jgi:methionyl-tRNA formyltransferase